MRVQAAYEDWHLTGSIVSYVVDHVMAETMPPLQEIIIYACTHIERARPYGIYNAVCG